MAEVFLARRRGAIGFEKTVAIKVVLPHVANERRYIEMLFDEARIGAQINHPRVVQTYAFGEDQGRYFMVMEHVAGESLRDLLVVAAKQKRHFDLYTIARIVGDVAAGLHAAHELRDPSGTFLGVIHRDVTPGNIVVSYDGEVKVIDFGVVKAANRMTRTMTGNLKGKITYMSPEQIRDDPLDRRSDIFSLGVVLWEMLTLRRLFRRKNEAACLHAILRSPAAPPSTHRLVPPEFDAIAARALAIDPKDRFQTALELQQALVEVTRDISVKRRKYGRRRLQALLEDLRSDRAETKCIKLGAANGSTGGDQPAGSKVLRLPLPEPPKTITTASMERVGLTVSASRVTQSLRQPKHPAAAHVKRPGWYVGGVVVALLVAAIAAAAWIRPLGGRAELEPPPKPVVRAEVPAATPVEKPAKPARTHRKPAPKRAKPVEKPAKPVRKPRRVRKRAKPVRRHRRVYRPQARKKTRTIEKTRTVKRKRAVRVRQPKPTARKGPEWELRQTSKQLMPEDL